MLLTVLALYNAMFFVHRNGPLYKLLKDNFTKELQENDHLKSFAFTFFVKFHCRKIFGSTT